MIKNFKSWSEGSVQVTLAVSLWLDCDMENKIMRNKKNKNIDIMTHHFIVDFVEMNFTNFIHHLFILIGYKPKTSDYSNKILNFWKHHFFYLCRNFYRRYHSILQWLSYILIQWRRLSVLILISTILSNSMNLVQSQFIK